jgi:prepilin-type processing-associated H-X9-DG protein
LIELLVVIAIIATLAAMLLPALTRARDMGKAALCLANTRQFGLAFQQYAADFDSALPWAWNSFADQDAYGHTGGGEFGGYGGYTWALLVYPYVNDIDAYACPAFGGRYPKYDYAPGTGHPYIYGANYRSNAYFGNYGYGFGTKRTAAGTLGSPVGGPWWFKPCKLDRVVRPDDKVCVVECSWDHCPYGCTPSKGREYFRDFFGDGDRTRYDNYDPWYWKPNIGTWHLKSGNVAFLDGHAERQPWQSAKLFNDGPDDLDMRHWSPYD